VGTVDPPYFNGALMQTYGSVAAQGNLKAIGVHILPNSYQAVTLPFVMNGSDSITFIYLDDSVCTRLPPIQGYSAAGSIGGSLATSTNDICFGIVLGSNGQVEIKGDTVALTLVYDTLTCRIGYIVPGDSVLTCLATDVGTLSGYWYTPPAVYVNTTTSVLVEAGHYVFNPVYNYYPGTWHIDYNGNKIWDTLPYVYYTYPGVWVPDRYETVSSGYWQTQDPVWVVTGTSGQVSACFISIADTMIGVNYISRPRIG
jgi:hypothetical protein